MLSRKKIMLIAAVAGVFVLLVAASSALPKMLPGFGSQLTADDVARVNDVSITREQLNEYIGRLASLEDQVNMPEGEDAHKLELQAVDELVNEELIRQLAAERGVSVSDEEIDAKLAEIKRVRYENSDAKLQEAMEAQGVTYQEARQRLGEAMVAQRLRMDIVAEATDVTDSDVETYYNDNQDKFAQTEARRVRHILSASPEAAQAARQRLEAGGDVNQIVQEVSLDLTTNAAGGDLGWISQGMMAPTFDAAAFSLAPGVWSEPVQTPSGWNIIRVEEVEAAHVPPLDEVREDVRTALIGQQGDTGWSDWLNKRMAEADIEFASGYDPREAGTGLPAGHP